MALCKIVLVEVDDFSTNTIFFFIIELISVKILKATYFDSFIACYSIFLTIIPPSPHVF